MAYRYFPPTDDFDSPNPYPHVTNPKTGAPFTFRELAAIHRLLWDELLATATRVIEQETDCGIPDFMATSDALADATNVFLWDALGVTNACREVCPGDEQAASDAATAHPLHRCDDVHDAAAQAVEAIEGRLAGRDLQLADRDALRDLLAAALQLADVVEVTP